MKKIIISFCIFFALIFRGYTQFTPPSPDMASLGKSVSIPINNYNGTYSVSIPIYTVVSGDISLPIKVDYNSSGITVDEEASFVGLGWALNAGGMITQIIRSKDDLDPIYGYIKNDFYKAFFQNLSTSGIGTFYGSSVTDPEKKFDFCKLANQIVNKNTLFTMDLQPDAFSFNFAGLSGSFMMNPLNQKPLIINRQMMKIERYVFSSNSNLDYWVITTDDGVKYTFGYEKKSDGTEIQIIETATGTKSGLATIESKSWMLTSIESPTGNKINLNYEPVKYCNLPLYSESEYISGRRNEGKSCKTNRFIEKDIEENFVVKQHMTRTIKQIDFNNGYINFRKSQNPREDILCSYKLDAIEIFTTGRSSKVINSQTKSYIFNYDYFTNYNIGTLAAIPDYGWTNGYYEIPQGFNMSSIPSKRLKLLSIQESGGFGVSKINPYEFFYNEIPLPNKTSLSRDHWGFYNGQYNFTLTPQISIVGTYMGEEPCGYAKRNTYDLFMRAGILQAIKYPTGSFTSYSFEPNAFESLYRGDSYIDPKTDITFSRSVYVYDDEQHLSDNDQTFVLNEHEVLDNLVLSFNDNFTKNSNPKIYFYAYKANGDEVLLNTFCQKTNENIGVYKFDYLGNFFGCTDKCTFKSINACYASTRIDRPNCCNSTEFSDEKLPIKFRIRVSVGEDVSAGTIIKGSVAAALHIHNGYATQVIGAGLRIKSVRTIDALKNTKNMTTYQYSNTNNSNDTPNGYGKLMSKYNYANVFSNTTDGTKFMMINSYSSTPMSTAAQGGYVGYNQITEKEGIYQNQGKTVYTYTNNGVVSDFYLPPPPGTPTDALITNGNLESKEIYGFENGNYRLLKEIKNTYNGDNEHSYINKALSPLIFSGINLFNLNSKDLSYRDMDCILISIGLYRTVSVWNKLTKTEEIQYDQKANE